MYCRVLADTAGCYRAFARLGTPSATCTIWFTLFVSWLPALLEAHFNFNRFSISICTTRCRCCCRCCCRRCWRHVSVRRCSVAARVTGTLEFNRMPQQVTSRHCCCSRCCTVHSNCARFEREREREARHELQSICINFTCMGRDRATTTGKTRNSNSLCHQCVMPHATGHLPLAACCCTRSRHKHKQ